MVQTKDINIEIKAIGKTHFYQSVSANRTIMGKKIIQFVHEKKLALTLIEKDKENLLFEYKLIKQKMEGSGLIHEWAADMERLQEHLIIKTDDKGNFLELMNFEEIQGKWDKKTIKELKRKYTSHKEGINMLIDRTSLLLEDKKQLEESFKGYNLYRCFFQGYFDTHDAKEELELNIKEYFGEIDLPLIIQSTHLEGETPDVAHQISNTAKLNKRSFKRHDFARMLKIVTDIFDIDATLTIDMEEKYRFTQDYFLKDAELFLQTHVNNWYSITNSHVLKSIDTFHTLK